MMRRDLSTRPRCSTDQRRGKDLPLSGNDRLTPQKVPETTPFSRVLHGELVVKNFGTFYGIRNFTLYINIPTAPYIEPHGQTQHTRTSIESL
jgi:hypothetical protein